MAFHFPVSYTYFENVDVIIRENKHQIWFISKSGFQLQKDNVSKSYLTFSLEGIAGHCFKIAISFWHYIK